MNINLDQLAKQISPQSFESNDGRFRVEVCDEGMFELTMTMLDASDRHYMNKEEDWVQTLEFSSEDLDRLIEILHKAKEVNTKSWETVKREIEKRKVD